MVDRPAQRIALDSSLRREAGECPAAATETERTPAPDSRSRQPPQSLLVTFTASPLTLICTVRIPAIVA